MSCYQFIAAEAGTVFRSTDNGRTWTVTPPQNDGKTLGAIQPSILVYPDGRLLALGRTRHLSHRQRLRLAFQERRP